MTGIVITETLTEAQALAQACQAWMQAHVPGYRAERWDVPKQRPSDGKFCVIVDDRTLEALPPAVQERIETMNPADGWEPAPAGSAMTINHQPSTIN